MICNLDESHLILISFLDENRSLPPPPSLSLLWLYLEWKFSRISSPTSSGVWQIRKHKDYCPPTCLTASLFLENPKIIRSQKRKKSFLRKHLKVVGVLLRSTNSWVADLGWHSELGKLYLPLAFYLAELKHCKRIAGIAETNNARVREIDSGTGRAT